MLEINSLLPNISKVEGILNHLKSHAIHGDRRLENENDWIRV